MLVDGRISLARMRLGIASAMGGFLLAFVALAAVLPASGLIVLGLLAVLAIGVSFESNARLAGIYGAQILNGAKVEQLKVGLVSPPDIAVSFLKARDIGMRVPFSFFEIASYIYDYNGATVRSADAKATN